VLAVPMPLAALVPVVPPIVVVHGSELPPGVVVVVVLVLVKVAVLSDLLGALAGELEQAQAARTRAPPTAKATVGTTRPFMLDPFKSARRLD
jgi:hypothetical protein